jgi:hypothetical protein
MVLSLEVRGLVENYIDKMIKDHIPLLVSRFRQKEVKDMLQYKDEEDFIYGAIYGAINYGFMERYIAKYQNIGTEEEAHEIRDIINKRMREVKEAIFKAG